MGELQQVEIVGIFHVNGFQPESEWVAEIDSAYNYLFTDLAPVLYLTMLHMRSSTGFPGRASYMKT